MAAYTLPPLQCIRSCFPSINCSCPDIRFSSVSSSSSELRSHSIFMNGRRAILPVRTRASSEGAPSELVEDPKFVPLNADDPVFGPPALFLMGFDLAETSKMQKFLKELDGEFLKVTHPFINISSKHPKDQDELEQQCPSDEGKHLH
ncbi:uncharacterized protein LOC110036896 [Phalaenopsis equestris]|uniref:uncharacterized protein LOC110036896 n=1 Tax=Phalaenopsis equestris TaxID=78828 RepID=UPI0009E4047D|nr:uncharacterized protein LOC110036896 [Phalaenopsis equestris]